MHHHPIDKCLRMDRSSRLILILSLIAVTSFDFGSCNYRQKRIVGGGAALAPPVDDPVVFVANQDSDARITGTRDPETGYYLFRGIRYAQPPLGNRRFQRSAPLYFDGDVNATEWGPPCPQPDKNGKIIGSEDCLFLNVFTPALPDTTDGYPVLIWIHGGGFRRGAATQYEMRDLVNKKVIVVSIQYRLGSLGFLSDGSRDLSGNNGLFDMLLATEWVRDYIEFFGGNPKKITAFGQGTGASSAFLLGLSQFGNKYYSGIVAMSGSVLSRFAVDKKPVNTTKTVATNNNCPTDDPVKMVQCLRELPAKKIIEQDSEDEKSTKTKRNFISDLSDLLGSGPVVEGKDDDRSLPNFVLDQPEELLNSNDLPEIPLLTGVMKDETGAAVYGPFKNQITDTLKKIPDFLTKVLVPDLQKIVPSIGNVTKLFQPQAFTKYLNPFSGGNKNKSPQVDGIAKVTEALNDAIFNAPAYLTLKNWAKKSKAFLYSFDHKSKAGFGKDFLDGVPLVGNSIETGKTSHGDDLGYVFQPNTIFGEPMPKNPNFNQEDQEVKEVFTDLIANFARGGNATFTKRSNDGNAVPFSVPSFGGKDDDGFLSITSTPQIGKQFRFCEMGLWTGELERYKSAACSLFQVENLKDPLKVIQKASDLNPIKNVRTNPADLLNVKNPVNLPGIPSGPSINLNPFANRKSDQPSVPNPTKTLPSAANTFKNPIQTPKLPGFFG